MKKLFYLLSVSIVFMFSLVNVCAQDTKIAVYLDGKPISTSQDPIIDNETILVPFRNIFEALNFDIKWDEFSETITGSSNTTSISLKIGDKTAYVNNQEKQLSVAPRIEQGSTMVPLRFIAEAAGYDVKWNPEDRRVLIGEGEIEGEIRLSNVYNSGNFMDVNSIYVVDGTDEFSGYKKLMGHPYENIMAIYYQGTNSSHMITTKDLNYNPNEMITWSYQGKTFKNSRKDIYSFLVDSSKLSSYIGNSIMSQTTQQIVFGNVYDDWIRSEIISQDAVKIVDAYLEKIEGVQKVNRFSKSDFEKVIDNFPTNETIYNLDGITSDPRNEKSDEFYLQYNDFKNKWIGEDELKTNYNISTIWLRDKIHLTKGDKKLIIDNAPDSKFEVGTFYEGNNIVFQYVKNFEAGGDTIELNQIFFERNSLINAGLLK